MKKEIKEIPSTEEEALSLLEKYAPLPPYNNGFEARNIVLQTALILEKTVSAFIADLLGIEEYQKSLTLGTKGSALSFSQKIDLLIDLEVVSNTDKSKYKIFMEIRNKFMHVFEANSFKSCFEYLPDALKFLFKKYPQSESLIEEEACKSAVVELCDEILKITFGILNKVIEKRERDNEADLKATLLQLADVLSKPKKE